MYPSLTHEERAWLSGAALCAYSGQNEGDTYNFTHRGHTYTAAITDGFPEYENGKLTIQVYYDSDHYVQQILPAGKRHEPLAKATVWEEE